MSNAAETIALPSPVTPEETLPQSLVGSSGAHAVYRGGPSGDVTRYGSPRPSPVHVHGASDWPDEAPTVGIAGGAPRSSRGFGVKRPSGPRALVRERADTRPPAPKAEGRLPRARSEAIRPAPFDSSERAPHVRPGRVGASVGPASALGPVPVRPLRIDDPAEARPARAVSPFWPEPVAALHPGERTHDIEDTTPSRQVRAYVPAQPHSSQLRLKKPSPKALASRQPTVQYMPEPETHALGVGATSLFLTAALLAGCAAGMAAFQLLI